MFNTMVLFFLCGGIEFIVNSLIQQMFIVVYDVPDPVPGGGEKKQTKVPTCTELHLSGHQQAINNYAIDRIYEKGMCALDKNKVQKGHNKECSRVRVGQGQPQERIAFD